MVPLLAAATISLLALRTLTMCLCDLDSARAAAQGAIFVVVLARIGLARLRAEQNRVWAAYLVAMILAPPLWLAAELGLEMLGVGH